MLYNTFQHIPGIGKKTEEKIWKKQILTWDLFLSEHKKINISESKIKKICKYVELSKIEIEKKNHLFFLPLLSRSMHWRAYPEFADNCCFLDIETTGLSRDYHDITTIAVYDGKESKVFIQGKNLDEFRSEIKKYSLIVTYNGICFDIPFIEQKLPDIGFDHLHVDLRFALKKIGYSGGLKSIEKQLGIVREGDICDVDGYEAVRLWKRYKRGDKRALDKLMKYNIEDVVNLKTLMDITYKNLREKSFSCIQ
ncbi:exonuclease [Candidatus Woesearchaeota archaeon]|nr:exonuclease [Candidatus Woesearchaeota archaeon]